MAVVRIGPLTGNEMDLGQLTDSRATRRWLAVTNSRYTGEAEIFQWGIGAGILPIPYETRLASNQALLCRRLRAKQESSPLHWIVEAEYSSEPLTQSDSELPPTQRRAKIRWTTSRGMEAISRDINGKAVLNSAGDYFDPPVEVVRSFWEVSVTKNVAAVPSYILEYADGINQSSWTIQGRVFQPQTALITAIDIGEEQEETIDNVTYTYYEFSYTVTHNRRTWKLKVLDQGFRYRSGTGRKNIQTNDSQPRDITSPALLDGSGQVLSNPTPETAKYQEFDGYIAVDFSALPVA